MVDALPAAGVDFFLSSGRNVFDENENLPSWVQTRPCLTRNTSRMSPLALANRGSCNDKIRLIIN
jgi:hypothetical protein